MRRILRSCSLAVSVACLLAMAVAPAWTQDTAGNEQGLKPYGTFHGGDIDEVSMVNGKLTLKIPLISYPQRGGKIPVGFSLVYANPEYQLLTADQSQNKPFYWTGWYTYAYMTQGENGAINILPDFDQIPGCIYNGGVCSQYGVWSPDGSVHQMGQTSSTNWVSLDATGYAYNSSTNVLTDREGVKYTYGTINSTNYISKIEDSNGNLVTTTSAGWTDTLNRSIPAPLATTTTNYPAACTLQGLLPVDKAYVWNAPGINGGTAQFTFCFAQVLGYVIPPGCAQNPPPQNYCYPPGSGGVNLQTIVLPDGTAWQFQYSTGTNGNGALTQITYPTGATISYTWGWYTYCLPINHWQYYGLGVGTRTVNANDGSGPKTWTYGGSFLSNGLQTTITDPLGNVSAHSETTLNAQSACSLYETQESDYTGAVSNANLLKTVTTAYNYSVNPYGASGPYAQTAINVIPSSIVTEMFTSYPNGYEKEISKTYDTGIAMTGTGAGTNALYGLVTKEQEYDYGSNAVGGLIRTTNTTYLALSNSNYLNNNLLTLPYSVQVQDSSNTQRKYTQYSYDMYSLVSSGIGSPTHDTNPPDGTYRGNVTSVSRWLNDVTTSTTNCPISVSNGNLTSYFVYNDTGTADHTVDSCGSGPSDANHKTSYVYSGTYLGAFPTTVTNALGQATTYAYDLNSGLKTSVTDPNNQTIGYQYDEMFRPTQITYPLQQVNGTGVNGLTTFTYPSSNDTEVVMTELMDNNGNDRVSYLFTDGLHRNLRHLVTNGETTPYDEVDTCYDGAGNVSFKSYPYQSSAPAGSENCSQPGDTFSYDGLHRLLTTTHSDGSTRIASYSGRATSKSDEGNGGGQRVQRISQVDGLGRLASLCEVSGNMTEGTNGNQTAAACNLDISGTGFLTTYGYDALDNLTSVAQGNLSSRSYSYDSLSRLEQATNPESGTTCYGVVSAGSCQLNGYDANGNLIEKTDARLLTITYAYDYLNRLTGKSYTDSTPAATFAYDQASAMGVSLTNTIGRRSSMDTAGAYPTGSVFSYDSMGRVLNNSQCTPQNCGTSMFGMTYTYDLIGDITSFTDAVGILLSSTYNHGGRLTGVTSNLSDANHPANLYSGVHYNPAGSVSTASMGNPGSNSIAETRTYDGRLRLLSITDGSVYNVSIPSSGGYAPDSDILQAVDSVNGTWSYSYDQMNRVCNANNSARLPQCGQSASYNYSYDRFGNMWSGIGSLNVSFNALNNRIDQLSTQYDAAGNLLNDGYTTYTYDSENRATSATNSVWTVTYVYDADGQRIRKSTTTNGLIDYLYDLGGHTTTIMNPGGTWNRGEIYAGSRHLGAYQAGYTFFTSADWLGTERARTNSNSVGSACETITSKPFGDDLTGTGPCGDPSPMHFTGKEWDPESGLNDFGARYDSSQFGRFMTADPLMASGRPSDPQSWNRYVYGLDNPITVLDPTGLAPCITGTADACIGDDPDKQEHAGNDARNQQAVAQKQSESSGKTAERIIMAGEALVNTEMANIKIKGAEALGALAPETDGATAVPAALLGVSAAGNLAAAGVQAVGVVTGKTDDAATAAKVATTVTSPTGMATLIGTHGNLETASRWASREAIITASPKELFGGSLLQVTTKVIDFVKTVKDAF